MERSVPFAAAETLAIKALGYLVDSGPALDRFMAESGADAPYLRERAADPEFLAAVLDFLLTDDSLLGGFCEAEQITPKTLHLVRHALPGG